MKARLFRAMETPLFFNGKTIAVIYLRNLNLDHGKLTS